MSQDPNVEKYRLTPEQHEDGYELVRERVFKPGAMPPEQDPTIIIVGGQMGAGKTNLLVLSTDSFDPPNLAVKINGDDFRQDHLLHDEIFDRYPDKIADYTDADVRPWTERAFNEAIEAGNNIIFEATLRSHEQISATIKRLKASGYIVDIRVVAVSGLLSTLGIFKRYEEQIAEKGVGRWTDLSKHEEAYMGVPATLDHFQNNNLLDRIALYRRDKTMVFETLNDNGEWSGSVTASTALQLERERDWSAEEKQEYLEGWQAVVALAKGRQERGDDVEHLPVALELLDEAERMQSATDAKTGQGYFGEVVAVTPNLVFQNAFQGEIVQHRRSAFAGQETPVVGELLRVGAGPARPRPARQHKLG